MRIWAAMMHQAAAASALSVARLRTLFQSGSGLQLTVRPSRDTLG